MEFEGSARNHKGLGAFRGHFGAPPASRRAAQDAFFIEIWGPNQLNSMLVYWPDIFLHVQKRSGRRAGRGLPAGRGLQAGLGWDPGRTPEITETLIIPYVFHHSRLETGVPVQPRLEAAAGQEAAAGAAAGPFLLYVQKKRSGQYTRFEFN